MTSVFDAVVEEEPPLDLLVLDEHAPTPAARRPTAAKAMSFLGLGWLIPIFTFLPSLIN
jgi:hypothetical protein